MSEYANSMLGTAALALDNWKYAQSVLGTTGIADEERAVLEGRCQAYCVVLGHVTGIPAVVNCRERWQSWIDSAPQS